jgi:FkbM family methyltransferase
MEKRQRAILETSKATALQRSFDIYYRDCARAERMDRLNALFVPPGGLAFDIGAHVGDRTASFVRLGASAVAVEPQPWVFRALRLIHVRTRNVTLLRAAVGARSGVTEFHVNAANPTVSTASRKLIEAARSAENWKAELWDDAITVSVTTLDLLIADYGRPDFIKIDVEGYELEVLRGLSAPVPCLSFEFTTLQREIACDCVQRLGELAPYDFNISLGEEHQLRHTNWRSPSEICEDIRNCPETANSGDIYAVLA